MAQKKTISNFNALRPVIVTAHKGGNRKAISKDMVSAAGISSDYLLLWQSDCNKLRRTVADYVLKKRAVKYGYQIGGVDITADDVAAAREAIFPKWKEILQVGEKSKEAKELRVDVDDVEDLIGFAWDFMDSGKGTVEHVVTEQIFRKKVESLLGCAIAKNEVLDDSDRDKLTSYRSAEKRIQNAIDTKAELDAQKKSLDELLKSIPDKEEKFQKYLKGKIAEIDEELKATAERKSEAEKDRRKLSADANAILQRIRFAK